MRILITTLLLCMCTTFGFAQDGITVNIHPLSSFVSASGSGSAGSTNIRWALGETLGSVSLSYVGVEETALQEEYRLALMPNPANEFLILEQASHEPVDFVLYSTTGQLLQQGQLSNINQRVEVAHLPSQVYFLRCHDKNGQLIKNFKVIVSH